ARKAIAGAVAYAHKNNAAGVIAVVDDGGNLMALERLDGTFAAGSMISIGKARTAALFKKPTKFFEDVIGKGRTSMVALNDFTPLQGGVPIEIDGRIVGAIGVSGANSAQQDEELAKAGAAAVTASPGSVTYFPSPRISSGAGGFVSTAGIRGGETRQLAKGYVFACECYPAFGIWLADQLPCSAGQGRDQT